jgi:HK97 family phage portal protein
MIDRIKSLFSNIKDYTRAKLWSGYAAIFSQFGNDVYKSDVVQACIDIIATEISKLQPRHIRTDNNDMQTVPKGSLNRLFKFGPNELMTTSDFLEKVIWLLFLNYNAFILPTYEIYTDSHGNKDKNYTGLYPLNPTTVDFLQDGEGKLYVKMYFSGGDNFTVPYSEVIHLRKKYSLNEIMGGGVDGRPDNAALIKVLGINDTVLQGLDKGVRAGLSIRGIIKINTMTDTEGQVAERKRLEAAARDSDSGIVALDMKGDYTPLPLDPKLVDKETLDFLQNKTLNWYGVSKAIYSRDYTDDQYQAWYESTLEPLVISFGQAFSKGLFTHRQLDVGNEVKMYQKDMMYLSTKAKLELMQTAGDQGLLTDNQKLALLGYPPIPDGDRRTQSLNYVDTRLINAYQMGNKDKTKGGTTDE